MNGRDMTSLTLIIYVRRGKEKRVFLIHVSQVGGYGYELFLDCTKTLWGHAGELERLLQVSDDVID